MKKYVDFLLNMGENDNELIVVFAIIVHLFWFLMFYIPIFWGFVMWDFDWIGIRLWILWLFIGFLPVIAFYIFTDKNDVV